LESEIEFQLAIEIALALESELELQLEIEIAMALETRMADSSDKTQLM
jgi:hypothetical protein